MGEVADAQQVQKHPGRETHMVSRLLPAVSSLPGTSPLLCARAMPCEDLRGLEESRVGVHSWCGCPMLCWGLRVWVAGINRAADVPAMADQRAIADILAGL